MPKQQDILVTSRDPEMAAEIAQAIAASDAFNVDTQVLVNGHHDPLQQAKTMPAVVVIGLTKTSQQELEAFSSYPADARPALIVVGSEAHSCLMRLSMQAGARDFLNYPLNPRELNAAVKRITMLKAAAAAPSLPSTTRISARRWVTRRPCCSIWIGSMRRCRNISICGRKRVCLMPCTRFLSLTN